MYKPTGHIYGYKYYTLDDLKNIYLDAREMEDPYFHLRMAMLDIASLTQKYAMILADNELRYEDDGK